MVLEINDVEGLPPVSIKIWGMCGGSKRISTAIQVSLRVHHLSSRLSSPSGHIPGKPTRARLAENCELKWFGRLGPPEFYLFIGQHPKSDHTCGGEAEGAKETFSHCWAKLKLVHFKRISWNIFQIYKCMYSLTKKLCFNESVLKIHSCVYEIN